MHLACPSGALRVVATAVSGVIMTSRSRDHKCAVQCKCKMRLENEFKKYSLLSWIDCCMCAVGWYMYCAGMPWGVVRVACASRFLPMCNMYAGPHCCCASCLASRCGYLVCMALLLWIVPLATIGPMANCHAMSTTCHRGEGSETPCHVNHMSRNNDQTLQPGS
jgi:hypothetical protein